MSLKKEAKTTLFVTGKNYPYQNRFTLVFKININGDIFDEEKPGNIKELAYFICEGNISDVLIGKDIIELYPDVISIVQHICHENGKHLRFMARRQRNQTVTEQLISTPSDIAYVDDLLDFPAEITISPIMRQCNIACRFCEQAYTKVPDRMMSMDVFERTIDAIPADLGCNVTMTPFMEPLSSKTFLKYLEMICTRRPAATVGFNTNGILLTENIRKFIIDIGLKYIVVTLNLPGRHSYKNFMGKDFYDKIENNIRMLAKDKAAANSKYPKVTIQFLNLEPVVGNERELRKKWEPYCDSVYFRNVSAPVESENILKTQVHRLPAMQCYSMLVTCAIDLQGYYLPCCLLRRRRAFLLNRKYKFMEIGNVRDMDCRPPGKVKNGCVCAPCRWPD